MLNDQICICVTLLYRNDFVVWFPFSSFRLVLRFWIWRRYVPQWYLGLLICKKNFVYRFYLNCCQNWLSILADSFPEASSISQRQPALDFWWAVPWSYHLLWSHLHCLLYHRCRTHSIELYAARHLLNSLSPKSHQTSEKHLVHIHLTILKFDLYSNSF